jgi:hypothetical protein
MNRKVCNRPVKPWVEVLEGRNLPSFLLSGAVDQLAIPLNNLLADMNAARQNLLRQIEVMKNPGIPVASNLGAPYFGKGAIIGYTEAFGAATADWQRMVNDQYAIDATVKADMAFITAVAHAGFANGDPTDLAILLFGKHFGIDPTAKLTDIQTQAGKIINDPAVQSQIKASNHVDIRIFDFEAGFSTFNFLTIEKNAPGFAAQVDL